MVISAMSQTLYLKYRPQKFSELDVVEVRKFFEGLLSSSRMPHAFLFTGPRGIGKTSAARILARCINCELNVKNKEDGKLVEPCGKCFACKAILEGSALDVIEIDAASNRGIDDVRQLREMVRLAPTMLTYKVFVIDECHMLTTEAANALLKTLEEPPAKTIFVLCTTEVHKVLPTIVSRCTRVAFRRAKLAEIVDKLSKICKAEGAELSDKSLEFIAKAGGGSFRDAVKLLEQILISGQDVSDIYVEEFLGQQMAANPAKLLEALFKRDVVEAMIELKIIIDAGVSLRVFIERAIEQIRGMILIKSGVIDSVRPESVKIEMSNLIALVRAFERSGRELKDAFIAELPLELLVVEWCGVGSQMDGGQSDDMDLQPVKANPKAVVEEKKVKVEEKVEEVKLSGKTISMEEVETKWSDLLKAIRPKNYSIEALLRLSKPVSVVGDRLELEVLYKFHKERLEAERSRRIVEESMQGLFGVPLKLECVIGESSGRKKKDDKDENISGRVGEEIVKAAEEIFGVEAV